MNPDSVAANLKEVHTQLYGRGEINSVFGGGNVVMMFIAQALEHIAGAIQIVAVAMYDRNRLIKRQCDVMEKQQASMEIVAKAQQDALKGMNSEEAPEKD